MNQPETRFACISLQAWKFRSAIGREQQERLEGGTTFEEIIKDIKKNARLVDHRREKCSKPNFYRVVVRLRMDSSIVDLFHNSPCGYRAQYYKSVSTGVRANRYAILKIIPSIMKMLSGNEKRTCPLSWVEKSLLHQEAKLWIYQGRWLRDSRPAERNLTVKRWMCNRKLCSDKKNKKKESYGSLTPAKETQIEIKGGFITIAGLGLTNSMKPNRGKNINECGFT